MDPRYDTRLREMSAQAEVAPEQIDGFLERLKAFVDPFAVFLASARYCQSSSMENFRRRGVSSSRPRR